jgi:hypothetical protein
MDNPVSLGNRANQGASPVKVVVVKVVRAVNKGANPVKVAKAVKPVKPVKAAANAPEARQVNRAEPWQAMSGTASPVRRAMQTVAAAIATATGMAPTIPATRASPVRLWRLSKVPTRPTPSARSTRG